MGFTNASWHHSCWIQNYNSHFDNGVQQGLFLFWNEAKFCTALLPCNENRISLCSHSQRKNPVFITEILFSLQKFSCLSPLPPVAGLLCMIWILIWNLIENFFSIKGNRTHSNMNALKYARSWVNCYAGQNQKKLSQQVTVLGKKKLANAVVNHHVMNPK